VELRLQHVTLLPTCKRESAGLCTLALPRNLIPVAANQRPGLVARGKIGLQTHRPVGYSLSLHSMVAVSRVPPGTPEKPTSPVD